MANKIPMVRGQDCTFYVVMLQKVLCYMIGNIYCTHIAGNGTSYLAWQRMVDTVKVIIIYCIKFVCVQLLCFRDDALLA